MQSTCSHKHADRDTGMVPRCDALACERCGEKFRSAADRLRLEPERYVCGHCYQNILYPDLVFRHSDLPD